MNANLRFAAQVVGIVLAASACTAPDASHSAPNTSATGHARLNGLSATDLVDTIHSAGLPTPNTEDVTAKKCAKLHCVGAIDSDTVSILKFDRSGAAQQYAGTISNSYQVEDVVLTFAPTVTAGQKAAYERVVEQAMA